MSPRPMRRYVSPVLYCVACLQHIVGETRMVSGELAHPVCAARADHAIRCERVGPPPQATFEACPHRANHERRAAA